MKIEITKEELEHWIKLQEMIEKITKKHTQNNNKKTMKNEK